MVQRAAASGSRRVAPPKTSQAERRAVFKNGALTVEKILEYTSTRTGERVDP
jgi:hypothetical protein